MPARAHVTSACDADRRGCGSREVDPEPKGTEGRPTKPDGEAAVSSSGLALGQTGPPIPSLRPAKEKMARWNPSMRDADHRQAPNGGIYSVVVQLGAAREAETAHRGSPLAVPVPRRSRASPRPGFRLVRLVDSE